MSASSGISVSHSLSDKFAEAIESRSVRFIKVTIQNESLVHDLSIDIEGTFQEDLEKLQNEDILHDNTPAYILVRLDDPPNDWLAVYYVPDNAKVRDKMLYASTRASLMKSLGSASFTDSIFATSKADLTPEAYESHRKHVSAPKPLSAREQEMATIRAAEAASSSYEGNKARASPLSTGVGLTWTEDVENAVKQLGEGEDSGLVIISIDTTSERLVLHSASSTTVDALGSSLLSSEPCYAFFAWNTGSTRTIVFIYSCPSTSPVKHRMVYSSGATSVFQVGKTLLSSSSSTLATRKIETSEPTELDEQFLASELGVQAGSTPDAPQPKGFARPKGPGRKR